MFTCRVFFFFFFSFFFFFFLLHPRVYGCVCVCVCVCVCPSRVFSPLLPPPPASGPYWNLHRYQLTLWQIAAVAVAEADAA